MKSKKRLPAYGTGALAIFTAFGWQAYVDEAAAADVIATRDNLSEIVVTGVRMSLKDSIATKRNSDRIADNITTAEIGQLPDVTIAEELNRLPGVNTTRDRGNASQASIRGLGPRLILGLVNGREVASSEPSQDLRWEIYPSEVLVKRHCQQDTGCHADIRRHCRDCRHPDHLPPRLQGSGIQRSSRSHVQR